MWLNWTDCYELEGKGIALSSLSISISNSFAMHQIGNKAGKNIIIITDVCNNKKLLKCVKWREGRKMWIKSQFKNTLKMHRPECVSVCVLAKINKWKVNIYNPFEISRLLFYQQRKVLLQKMKHLTSLWVHRSIPLGRELIRTGNGGWIDSYSPERWKCSQTSLSHNQLNTIYCIAHPSL